MSIADPTAAVLVDVVEEPNLYERLTLGLVLSLLVLGRLVQDFYVLPVGISLHVSDLIAGLLLVTWILWMVTKPRPFLLGIPGVLGALLMILIWTAPFLNTYNMSAFELEAAERGLVRGTLYAGIFLASYQLAQRRTSAYRITTFVIAMTLIQALIGVYESISKASFTAIGTLWTSIGMVSDTKAMRSQEMELEARLTGELRAYSTAPHSLVLSGLLVIGIGLCISRYLYSDSTQQRRRYVAAILVQMAALGATSQRTGFVALVALFVVLAITQLPKLPRALSLIFGLAVGGAAIAVVSPGTPRLILNFFTGYSTDHNVDVRTARYDLVPDLLAPRPLVGPGYLTGDPTVVIFDNAYLTQLLELGVIGLALLLIFLLVVAGRPLAAYEVAPVPDQPLILGALGASLTLFVTMATFDVLSFGQLFPTALILMAIGLARTDAMFRARRQVAPQGAHH